MCSARGQHNHSTKSLFVVRCSAQREGAGGAVEPPTRASLTSLPAAAGARRMLKTSR